METYMIKLDLTHVDCKDNKEIFEIEKYNISNVTKWYNTYLLLKNKIDLILSNSNVTDMVDKEYQLYSQLNETYIENFSKFIWIIKIANANNTREINLVLKSVN